MNNKIFRRFGLRFQFTFLMIVLALVMMTVVAINTARHQQETLTRERVLRGRALIRTWASLGRERLTTMDLTTELAMFDLMRMLLTEEEDVTALWLLDDKGNYIVHSEEKLMSKPAKDSIALLSLSAKEPGLMYNDIKNVTYYEHYWPVRTSRGKLLGVAHIRMSGEGVASAVRETIRNIVVVSLLVMLAGIIAITWLIYRITKPIKFLAEGAAVIGGGNLDYRIPNLPENELGDLGHKFNEMAQNLKQVQEDLIQRTITEASLKDKAKKLQKMASTDDLTGLFNKRQFSEDFPLVVEQSHVSAEPLTLMMLDMDRFKQLNDSHGHQRGDQALRDVAASILNCIRYETTDSAYRFGGDEFLILMRGAHSEGALKVAERIAQEYDRCKSEENMTGISFGVVELQTKESADTFLQRADDAMYEEKKRRKAAR